MKIVVQIVRIVVGILFIFSGLVKANDPAGLGYKMHEFFEAWGMQFLNSYALTFSVLMIAFEIIAGVALLIGWYTKLTIKLLLLLIIFFTFLTGYAWLSGKFKSCGCFGDCIPIKSNQSFYKDLILLALIVFLLFFQKYLKPICTKKLQIVVMLLAIVGSFFIQKYTLDHLPFKDCLSFKIGNNILQQKKYKADSVVNIYTYYKDGKAYLVTAPNYPQWMLDGDTTYIADESKTKTITITEGNKADMVRDFSLTTASGIDTTEALLSTPKSIYLFIVTELNMANNEWDKKFETFAKNEIKKDSNSVYIVTNKATEARQYFNKFALGNALPVLFCDEKPLLAAARTRPTIMKITNGTIVQKYTWKDIGK